MVYLSAHDEAARLEALRQYQILDTEPEDRFDAITRLAASICATPIALVTLVDDERQWFKARVGVDIHQTPREVSFCSHAVRARDVLIVTDTLDDARFAANPLVTGPPNIRFYAGAPLINADGHALGTLCVIDRQPRELRSDQVTALRVLSEEVMARLDLRRNNVALKEARDQLRLILDAAAEGICGVDAEGRTSFVNPAAARMLGWKPHELLGKSIHQLVHHSYADGAPYPIEQCPAYATYKSGTAHEVHGEVFWRRDGSCFPVEYSSTPMFRDGEVVGAVVVFEDIAARTRSEDALREHEAREGAMLATALDCVIAMDHKGRIIEFNPAAETTFGFSRALVLGEDLADKIIPPEFRAAHREGLARYLATGEAPVFGRRIELEAMRADGSAFPVELSITRTPLDGTPEFTAYLRDITERKRNEARLNYLATYDALTDLPNRVLMTDRLNRALSAARRQSHRVAVLSLGLDHFKKINDTLGHEVGDLLLKETAARLLACVRESDSVARLGGDEFAVMLTDIGRRSDVSRIAEKILANLSAPFEAQGQRLSITASIGVAAYPKDGGDANALLKNANAVMHRAKERGRNQYRHYSRAMGVRAAQRLSLENDLRQALARDEFLLHYQPIVALASGRILALEALLRWQRRDAESLISPAEFIPVLEQSGLIVAVGEWVLHHACAQNRAWQQQGLGPVRVAVNISARQFHQLNMRRTVERTLSETGLDPQYLELELTESLLQNTGVEHALQSLRKLGVRIAIDDFGTGYSSLSYLKRFSIDSLKIDRSFVQGTPTDADNAAIATAIVSMAHSLSLEVIAEGVETVEQLNFLRSIGCDAMQGFLVSRPGPAHDVAGLLHNRHDIFANQSADATDQDK